MKNLFDIKSLNKNQVDDIISLAFDYKEKIKNGEDTKLPFSSCVATLFYENSTRTKNSFEMAAKRLGSEIISITPSSSSITKGETLYDTLETLKQIGADVSVIRSSVSGINYLTHYPLPILNAGDGLHSHPTQALLDFMTIKEHFKDTKNLNVTIIGDLLHSRVARSNIELLNQQSINVYYYSPENLALNFFDDKKVKRLKTFEEVAKVSDVIIMLRMQFERQQQVYVPSVKEYRYHYTLTQQKFDMLKKNCIILHPGPVNIDVDIQKSVMQEKRCLVAQQVENGVVIRMAVLSKILKEKHE